MITELLNQLKKMRLGCEKAAEFVFDRTGIRMTSSVLEDLELLEFPPPSGPEGALLRNFAAWGNPRVGGVRWGTKAWLSRQSDATTAALYEVILEKGRFGLFECLSVEEAATTWRFVGAPGDPGVAEAVTDSLGDPVEPAVGELRVGWWLNVEGRDLLLFTMEMSAEVARPFVEAADGGAWLDEDAGAFVSHYYEADIISFALVPRAMYLGLHPFYYLPESIRDHLPRRFARAIPAAIQYRYYDDRPPWHLLVARRGADEGFRKYLHVVRDLAYRGTNFWWRHQLDEADLLRLVTDQEFYLLLGLSPDGTAPLPECTPENTWPLRILALPESFYEDTGLTGDDTVYTASKALGDSGAAEPGRAHELALRARLSEFMARMRWVHLVERLAERPEGWDEELRPHLAVAGSSFTVGYSDLNAVLRGLLPESWQERPVAEILEGRKSGRRIAKSLADAGVVKLSDLPEAEYELKAIKGIGESSVELLVEALREALCEYPPEFLGVASKEEQADARAELAEGLDELASLF